MINKLTNLLNRYQKKRQKASQANLLKEERAKFLSDGAIPWSPGYHEYKKEKIQEAIQNKELLNGFKNRQLPADYGYRLDERVVEYPWIFSKLPNGNQVILDAGSTLNFEYLVKQPIIDDKELTIYTYAPEHHSFNKKRISYVYGDLRNLPFKEELFDFVISQSTIEHIDMDNSMYGYDIVHNENKNEKSYDYLLAVGEMLRVLKKGGKLLITFPFGAFENHGFFQQFDEEMLHRIQELFRGQGSFEIDFFKYDPNGWNFAQKEELKDVVSHNPHTGLGFGDDYAAHSRAIACIEFTKE